MRGLADRCAVALDNAALYAQREQVAVTLQEELLPPRAAGDPGLDVAARYSAAGEGNQVGGDFYDVFASDTGWQVVIGDVVGKGPAAAAVTGLARHTMRAAAAYEGAPSQLLRVLNAALLAERAGQRLASVACVRLDPDETARGSPSASPAIRCRSSSASTGRSAGSGVSVSCWAWRASSRSSTPTIASCPASCSILYTDGITEARGPGGMFGEDHLRSLLMTLGGEAPTRVLQRVEAAVLAASGGRPRDDLALVALRLRSAHAAGVLNLGDPGGTPDDQGVPPREGWRHEEDRRLPPHRPGLLAVPAIGQAAETVGNDLAHAPGNQSMIFCGEGVPQCTIIADQIPWTIDAPDDQIITRWSAQLANGTQARLRLLRRNSNGTYTGAGTSDAITATSTGVHTSRPTSRCPPATTRSASTCSRATSARSPTPTTTTTSPSPNPVIDDGSTRRVQAAAWELHARRPGRDRPQQQRQGRRDRGRLRRELHRRRRRRRRRRWRHRRRDGRRLVHRRRLVGTGDLTGPGGRPEEKVEPKGPPFVVDTRALLRPGKQGKKGEFDIYAENDGSGDLDATFEIRAGRKVIGKASVTEMESGDDAAVGFKLPAELRKSSCARARSSSRWSRPPSTPTAATTPVKQDLTVLSGGARKYDGYYKGPGPIVFVVQGGAIRTVSSEVNAFCPRTNRHESLSIFSIDGFPALVKPDGSFSHEGSGGGQHMTYKGKLSVGGTSKGYASAYKFSLGVSDGGKYFTDGCTGARNWTAKKTR